MRSKTWNPPALAGEHLLGETNVGVSKSAAEKPDFSLFLRSIVEEFADLPVLPGGTKNLALCDMINLRVQFPPKASGGSNEKEADSRVRNLTQAVGEERAWLLIGEGGQGKSTALRFLAHHFARERLAVCAQNSSDAFIPVYLTLSRHKRKLSDQIRDALQRPDFLCTPEALDGWLFSKSFLFLIDRLDETDSHIALDDVVDLLRLAPKSRVVVASRPLAALSRWPFPQARLQPLKDSDIRSLLKKLLGDEPGGELFDALIRHQTLDAFRRPLFARLLALSSNDLTKRQGFTIGEMLRDVLEKRFLGSWERRSESNIEIELVQEILAWFGYWMVRTNSQAVKWETALRRGVALARRRDIQADVRFVEELLGRLLKQGLLERSDDELQFWHTNFRDYFAAVWIERNASRTSVYLRGWSPRWHEPLILFFGIIGERQLSRESERKGDRREEAGDRSQVSGAR